MKKILFAALMVVGLSSCSADSLLNQYEKACRNKDYDKMAKIALKLEKKELTTEQQERMVEISENCMDDFDF